jgi:hypothetical protein
MPVEALRDIVAQYVGGHKERGVRNMEEMIQDVCLQAAEITGAKVRVRADLLIVPPGGGPVQNMKVRARSN